MWEWNSSSMVRREIVEEDWGGESTFFFFQNTIVTLNSIYTFVFN